MGAGWDDGAIRRALLLGVVLFGLFVVVGGGVWLLGMALGLPRVTAFLVGMCGGPLLIIAVGLVVIFAMPLERRQRLVGIRPSDDTPAAEDPAQGRPEA